MGIVETVGALDGELKASGLMMGKFAGHGKGFQIGNEIKSRLKRGMSGWWRIGLHERPPWKGVKEGEKQPRKRVCSHFWAILGKKFPRNSLYSFSLFVLKVGT